MEIKEGTRLKVAPDAREFVPQVVGKEIVLVEDTLYPGTFGYRLVDQGGVWRVRYTPEEYVDRIKKGDCTLIKEEPPKPKRTRSIREFYVCKEAAKTIWKANHPGEDIPTDLTVDMTNWVTLSWTERR